MNAISHSPVFAPGVAGRVPDGDGLMKFVNLENFRYLTGHGKKFAEVVELALSSLDVETQGVVTALAEFFRGKQQTELSKCPQLGILQVTYDPERDRGQYDFAPFQRQIKPGDVVSSNDFGVQLILWRNMRPVSVTSLPLGLIIDSESFVDCYQVYMHAFVHDRNLNGPNVYIGVTKRSWQQRWREHYRSAVNGSHYRFHEAIRENQSSVIEHSILGVCSDEQSAMESEEALVGVYSLFPKGLNMIPGGYAGMRFLHRIGAVGRGERVSPDQKHEFINRFFETETRAGRPNPFATANWLNDEYAEKVICGGPDRLKPGQIREARYLKEELGLEPAKIAAEIGARNVLQVRRLIGGSTYSRIH